MTEIIRDIVRDVCFRPVEIDDAKFILELRTDPSRSRFISFTESDVEVQRQWISAYLERQRNGLEYYYIIEDYHSEKFGTIRIYDIRSDSFCWGSWIVKDGAPYYIAIESMLMALEIGFYRLGFSKSHGDVRKGNQSVINNHLRFGGKIIREDDLNYYLEYTRDSYDAIKAKYRKFYCLSPGINIGTADA